MQKGATFHAAFYLAFAGFLRMGEFTWTAADQQAEFGQWHMTRAAITFGNDRLYVQLPASKTDPFRRGVRLTIATAEDDACAFKSLHRLFVKFLTPLHAPLFDTDNGFSRQRLTNVLRDNLSALGYIRNYLRYLFRREAATSAARSSLSEEDIMTLGRWKSDSYKLYIEVDPNRTIDASRRHQHPFR